MIRDRFVNREDAGLRLAERLRDPPLHDPLVLAIPRGGVEVGAALARALGAELDVVLSRKLRAEQHRELALGAISEAGEVYLNETTMGATGTGRDYVERERRLQLQEIERRARMFRAVRARAEPRGRSVVVTDDGLATGSTMIAALHTVREQRPHELICAVPVAPPDRLKEVGTLCDRLVCLLAPAQFWAVGQFYDDFSEVSDERVLSLLAEFSAHRAGSSS